MIHTVLPSVLREGYMPEGRRWPEGMLRFHIYAIPVIRSVEGFPAIILKSLDY